uniref:V-type proton ATPase subunit a n=1 Tax=Glossina austeni TaxID=7395 RepID=A0A1A9UGN6_GLOAU
MGDMFRSEEMALCQMFIQPEAAYTSVSELGERGCVQFRDLNTEVNAFQRKFVTEVRRCDELERRMRYIEFELKKDNITFPTLDEDMEPFAPNPREIVDLEAKLESIETELRELSQNAINLNSNFLEMTELKHVLEKTQTLFSNSQNINLDSKNQMDHHQQSGQLSFVAGVIKLEKFFAFERMLWRISRGNIFLRRSEINEPVKDPETGHCISKSVFVAFFQGEQLKQRVKKVCAGFHAAIYPCPNSQQEREQMLNDIRLRLQDLRMVLNTTADHRNRVLVAASRSLATWSIMVKKMKAIYHTLNMFNLDVTNKCLIGEGWVPSKDLTIVQNALIQGSKRAESNVPSFLNVIAPDEQPPTFTRTNKFTRGFQNLIDSYGMATYREINPALYTCITFPFLFAVMFGDLGHGLVLLSFALLMVSRERQLRKIKGEIFNIFFNGRYIILLMALFSLYTGFIYNDIFSKSMNVFGSAWFVDWNHSTILNNSHLQMDPGKHVSAQSEELANTPGCAPSILILFINMMLFKHQEPLEGCEEYLFEQQELVQRIFVIIALACIPWMLLGKPLYLMCCKKKKVRPLYEETIDVEQHPNSHKIQKSDSRGHGGHDNDDEPMSEIFIQQAIHTIEYVLSTISHTASYLRLWALSLAHARILVLIEGLSAFLHTLRLHWVEFMSKFYEGLGYAFQPFSFKTLLEGVEE